jgi:predicted CXXCH cytochrome family protein
LQAAGKALLSGKDEWDFRPGLPLTDFRIDYQYRLGDDTMRVVGHVEQLHMSECYRQTDSLTCITCHDPHYTPAPAERVDYFRSICMKCHAKDSCGEPLSKRHAVAMNDCSHCHMVRKDTEVPHTALRHHRIGIHGTKQSEDEIVVGLAAVLDTSDLTPIQRDRCEAIAKFQVGQEQPDNPNFRDYGIESAKALIRVKNAGQADTEANTVLAMLARSQGQLSIANDIAREVVRTENQPSRAKIEALRLLAQLAYQRRDYQTAVKHYRELTQYQSEPHDYFHLGVSEQNSGDSQRAIAALEKAIDLAPAYVEAAPGTKCDPKIARR